MIRWPYYYQDNEVNILIKTDKLYLAEGVKRIIYNYFIQSYKAVNFLDGLTAGNSSNSDMSVISINDAELFMCNEFFLQI